MKIKVFSIGRKRETERLYDIYGSMILNVAHKYLQDWDLAADCRQEVMLRLSTVLEQIGEFGSDRARNFIYTVTKNAALNMQISRSRELAVETFDPDACLSETCYEDRYFVRGEFSPEVRAYLDELDEIDREIIYLHYGLQYKFSDIAKGMGKPLTTVEKRVSRARKRLELMMMEDEDFDWLKRR